jgi:hypothetical protein
MNSKSHQVPPHSSKPIQVPFPATAKLHSHPPPLNAYLRAITFPSPRTQRTNKIRARRAVLTEDRSMRAKRCGERDAVVEVTRADVHSQKAVE